MSKKNKIPYGGEQIIRNNIELLFISLIRRLREDVRSLKETQITHCSDKIVESVCNILSEKLDQASPISLDEICYRLGFSKSYVKVQFKKKTGTSVIQHYISLKIDKAKKGDKGKNFKKPTKEQMEKRKAEMRKTRKAYNEKLNEILTPEQQEKLKSLRKEKKGKNLGIKNKVIMPKITLRKTIF